MSLGKSSRGAFAKRARLLRCYREEHLELGLWLHKLVHTETFFANIGEPKSRNWYGVNVSEKAVRFLKQSTDEFSNYKTWVDLINLDDSEFSRRYGVNAREAIVAMESFCDQFASPGEFLYSRVMLSSFVLRGFEIEVVHLPEELEHTIFYAIYRQAMTKIDVLYAERRNRVLPPFRYRSIPVDVDFDRDVIRSPCPDAKTYVTLVG